MRACWVRVLLAATAAAVATAEVFTAMADMETLLGAENFVTGVIDQYISSETRRLERLREFAREYAERNTEALSDGDRHIANPINAYLLIKRLTADWSYVESLMRNNQANEFLTNITTQRESTSPVKFPDQEDLNGAAAALLRLQDTYRLDTGDMARGKLQGVKRARELTAHDCFELGKISYNQADYYHTVMWMQEALNRAVHESPPTVSEADTLEYFAFALYQQGNVKRALTLTKRLLELEPEHSRALGNVKWYEDELVAAGQKKDGDLPPVVNVRAANGESVPERDAYEALCRGEVPQSPKTVAKLTCYYKRDRPFLRLAPIKVEVVLLNPLAVIFVDCISDYEISVVKELAIPKLARATVQNAQTGNLETASYRISKSAWLRHEDHPVIARINNRIDMMTNLNMDTAEELQVANYGLGGHYEPHFDMSTRGEKDPYRGGVGNRIATILFYDVEIAAYGYHGFYQPHLGNRVATVLFYMVVPDAGGATVFPELKAAVFPRKNSALFWYNLLRDGDGDMTTRHAACPVLSGTKWVSNKWIHERGQEIRRPCGLSRSAKESFVGQL